MKVLKYLLLASPLLVPALTCAASFGALQMASPVTVNRLYQGYSDATFVTFTGSTLTGCPNNGGYLRPTWLAANGVLNHETADRMLSVLLTAKAQDLELEVRYRVNSSGTGWDTCSIDGIYLY